MSLLQENRAVIIECLRRSGDHCSSSCPMVSMRLYTHAVFFFLRFLSCNKDTTIKKYIFFIINISSTIEHSVNQLNANDIFFIFLI